MIAEVNKYMDILSIINPRYNNRIYSSNLDLLRKAHAEGDFSINEIISAQREYQNNIYKVFNGDINKIMFLNRSIGFEFEFATYKFKSDEKNQLPSHIELGKSESFSAIFNTPFILETDIYNELEIGIPPFLIANVNGKINKVAIDRIWQKLRITMQNINAEALDFSLIELGMIFERYGLGNGWQINNGNTDIVITKRKKHKSLKHQVYSQLNISVTAKEIAEFLSCYGHIAYLPERFEYFSATYYLLYNAISANIRTNEGKIALVHICKGLCNLLAIPSLLLLKDQPESKQNNKGVYSGVKETFGIWVKDSILNVIDYSLTDQLSREEVKKILIEIRSDIDKIMEYQIEKAMKIIRTQFGFKEEYKNRTFIEYNNTISELIERLNNSSPRYIPNERNVLFKKESFPAQGNGVRRDTYVNIPSPNDLKFHLAELRNDDHIENFTSY